MYVTIYKIFEETKKKQAMKLPSAVCPVRAGGRHRDTFWKQGNALRIPDTPVYHTYFYTKYFNNTSYKRRDRGYSRAVDRTRCAHTNPSLAIIFFLSW